MQPTDDATHAFASPAVRLSIGVTGHRDLHAAFAAGQPQIAATLEQLFAAMTRACEACKPAIEPGWLAPIRMHTLLAMGTDILAVELAQQQDWEVVAPLPFGLPLNIAINARPRSLADAEALLQGRFAGCDTVVAERALQIQSVAARVQCFELAEQDDTIAALLCRSLANPADDSTAHMLANATTERAVLAARVMLEQSDLLVAVWDGRSHGAPGGTGHTVAAALELGAPVLWIDTHAPTNWRILRSPEALATLRQPAVNAASDWQALTSLIEALLLPGAQTLTNHADGVSHESSSQHGSIRSVQQQHWHARSNPLLHSYRRIEALFGGESLGQRLRPLRQVYETPEQIASGSAAVILDAARNLPGSDPVFANNLDSIVLRRFAWADGLSTFFADAYRGGMVLNFLLAAVAVIAGVLWLPFGADRYKWLFALLEFLLLGGILRITAIAIRRRWHGRWFETRRIAEYLRHAPLLLLLGVARAPGRWPRGVRSSWPEWFARHASRQQGLPRLRISSSYLRAALTTLLRPHVRQQCDYHLDKARRLHAVHHNLDRIGEASFVLAILSVATYLLLKAGGAAHLWSPQLAQSTGGLFTFLGIFFPTLGGALSGIRYFGDFERFASISEVTAEKLEFIDSRMQMLLAADDSQLIYARVAELAHAVDSVVVTEIENWQAVFGGKVVTVPG